METPEGLRFLLYEHRVKFFKIENGKFDEFELNDLISSIDRFNINLTISIIR